MSEEKKPEQEQLELFVKAGNEAIDKVYEEKVTGIAPPYEAKVDISLKSTEPNEEILARLEAVEARQTRFETALFDPENGMDHYLERLYDTVKGLQQLLEPVARWAYAVWPLELKNCPACGKRFFRNKDVCPNGCPKVQS